MNYLPEKLVAYRKHYKFSQDYVARVLGVDVSRYMGLENGRALPSYDQMLRLANLYQVNVREIFENSPTVTLHKVTDMTTDEINIKFFMRQRRLDVRIMNYIKRHKVLTFSVLGLLIVFTLLYSALKPERINNPLVFNQTDNWLLSVSDTSVVYIEGDGVKATGDNSNGQISSLPNQNALKVAEGSSFTVVLNNDGTVSSFGLIKKYKDELDNWTNIVDISAGSEHVVGVDKDGKVYSVGNNDYGQCDTSGFENIKKVYAFTKGSVCIDGDGNARCAGKVIGSSKLDSLTGIVDIDCNDNMTVVAKEDGRVEYYISKNDHYKSVNSWRDIVSVAVGENFIVGLDTSGRVYVDCLESYIQKEVESWRDIVAIDAGKDYIIGFNGVDICGAGNNGYGQFETTESNTLIFLPMVTNIQYTIYPNYVSFSFDGVEHAYGYLVSITGNNIAYEVYDNKDINFPVDNLTEGQTYTVEITTLGKGNYTDSKKPAISYFVYNKAEAKKVEE